MTLLECFNKTGSDKGRKHSYEKIYEPILEKYRDEPINFLEIGVWKGHSIGSWLEYFPNATIYTMDVFTRVNEKDIKILDHPRVKWMKTDSTVKDLPERIREEWGDVEFDFVIDDGSHLLKDQRDTFTNIYPLLKKGGTYWIEDIFEMSEVSFMDIQNTYPQFWKKNSVWYSMEQWDKFMDNFDNFQYESITKTNHRKKRYLDSCVYGINK